MIELRQPFRSTLCFGCRHRGEAEGASRCLHPEAMEQKRAMLANEPGPFNIVVRGVYSEGFAQAFPDGFNEFAVTNCDSIEPRKVRA